MARLSCIGVLLLTALGLAGCPPGFTVVQTTQAEMVAPDGRHKVVIFSRDAGTATSENTHASVLETSEELPKDATANLFTIDHAHATVSWKANGSLLVVFDPGVRVFRQEPSVAGIAIEYRFR